MAEEGSSTAPTEVIQASVPEMSAAVAEAFDPKALEVLKKNKAARAAPVVEQVKEAPRPAKTPTADESIVIDLSDLGKEPAKTKPEVVADEDLTGLDETARKKIEDKNKEAVKLRRRAQEAEELAKTHETTLATHKEQLAAAQEEIHKLKEAPPAATNNVLGKVSDPRWIDYYEADAKEQLRKLNRATRDPDTDLNHKFADGIVRELTTADYDLATAIVEDAPLRRGQLQNFTKSQKAVKPIAEAFGAVPEWATAHSTINSLDWNTERPVIAAKAAIGDLVLSGAWTLVKKSAKASGATIPDTTGAGANAPSKTATAPKEIAQSQPQAARSDTGPAAIPSALRERAMKGDESAVLEMLKIKAQNRKMQAA